MLSKLRKHLNPPMVISVIALFAALGGGYAVAFSGSGSLQKGSVEDLTTSFTSFRTLTGIGNLQAACNLDTDGTVLRVHNSSGENLRFAYANDGGGAAGVGFAQNGEDQSPVFVATGSPGTTRMHIWPADGSKAPQADIVVSTFPPLAGDCTGPATESTATALVLNTQQ